MNLGEEIEHAWPRAPEVLTMHLLAYREDACCWICSELTYSELTEGVHTALSGSIADLNCKINSKNHIEVAHLGIIMYLICSPKQF